MSLELALEKDVAEKKTVVLKPQITQDEVHEIVEKKKTGLFGTVFTRPKPGEIKIAWIKLFYEPYWIASGSYFGDYYRKNVYEIKTDPTVKEVKIGEGVFPVQKESGGWSRVKRGISGEKENQLPIPVEEHVEIAVEDELVLNSHGNESKLNYKIETKHQENFPDKVLEKNKTQVRESSLTKEEVLEKLVNILKEIVEEDVKMVKEKIVIDRIDEVFVPIYEARCVDQKNKVQILRIDAINKKVLG